MDLQNWHEYNNLYLAAPLRWLRLRLEQCAIQCPKPVTPATSVDSIPPSQQALAVEMAMPIGNGSTRRAPFFNRWSGRGAPAARYQFAASTVPLLKAADLSEQIIQAASEREEAAKIEPAPALVLLSH